MFLATNAICKTRHSRQARQSIIKQMLDKAVRAILLIAFMSVVAVCSGVPFNLGISIFSTFSSECIFIGLSCDRQALPFHCLAILSW